MSDSGFSPVELVAVVDSTHSVTTVIEGTNPFQWPTPPNGQEPAALKKPSPMQR